MTTIALIDESKGVTGGDLNSMALALEVNLRHCAQAWGKTPPTVELWTERKALPEDYWALYFVDDDSDSPDTLAVHFLTLGKPAGRVYVGNASGLNEGPNSVCEAAAHESVELLCNPYLDEWRDMPGRPGWQVALESADPVQSSYEVEVDGIAWKVSNFVRREWFQAGSDGPYDYLGELTKPGPATGGRETRGLGDVGEGAVAIVPVEHGGDGGGHRRRGVVRPPRRISCLSDRVIGEVVRHEDVQPSITVGVEETGRGGIGVVADPRVGGRVFERPVAAIPVERVGTVIGDVEVGVTVVVRIPDSHSHPVARIGGSGRVGRDAKHAVVTLEQQLVHAVGRRGAAGDIPPAVHEVQIEVVVAVGIEESNAAGHAVGHEVVPRRRAIEVDVHAPRLRRVDEERRGRRRGSRSGALAAEARREKQSHDDDEESHETSVVDQPRCPHTAQCDTLLIEGPVLVRNDRDAPHRPKNA